MNPDDRQWSGHGLGAVRHLFLLSHLDGSDEQGAGCAVGQEDGCRVVVRLGEEPAVDVGGRRNHSR